MKETNKQTKREFDTFSFLSGCFCLVVVVVVVVAVFNSWVISLVVCRFKSIDECIL